MAKKTAKRKTTKKTKAPPLRVRVWRWLGRAALAGALGLILAVAIFAVLRPPTTPYILSEGVRLGGVERVWVPMEDIAPVMARSVVAAEDADFCLHWGFDMGAIRDAIADGGGRGASTLSQQVVKNVWLWQGRSWPRKALEGLMTPLVEAFWSKRRIVEIYLNVAEFDEGVFGIEAAAQHHFGIGADQLSARQAALLAAVLPNPKERRAVNPSTATAKRADQIADGAATIRADGRAACFEG